MSTYLERLEKSKKNKTYYDNYLDRQTAKQIGTQDDTLFNDFKSLISSNDTTTKAVQQYGAIKDYKSGTNYSGRENLHNSVTDDYKKYQNLNERLKKFRSEYVNAYGENAVKTLEDGLSTISSNIKNSSQGISQLNSYWDEVKKNFDTEDKWKKYQYSQNRENDYKILSKMSDDEIIDTLRNGNDKLYRYSKKGSNELDYQTNIIDYIKEKGSSNLLTKYQDYLKEDDFTDTSGLFHSLTGLDWFDETTNPNSEEINQIDNLKMKKTAEETIDELYNNYAKNKDWKKFTSYYNSDVNFYEEGISEAAQKGTLDKQHSVYVYLANKYGKEKADEYNASLSEYNNLKRTELEVKDTKEFAEKHPVLGTLRSFGTNLGSALTMTPIVDAVDTAIGKKVDTNSVLHSPTHITNALRNQVTNDIDSEVGKFIYQTANSAIDSAINLGFATALTGGVGAVGESIGSSVLANAPKYTAEVTSALMGNSVATNAIIEGKKKGYSDVKAVSLGMIRGAIEGITEKYSIDRIIKNPNLIKSAVTEGTEEVASNWMNNIVDAVANGDKSEFNQFIKAYKEENPDATDGKAFSMAIVNSLKDDGLAFLGGAMAGSAMGGVQQGINAVGNSLTGKDIKNLDNVNTLVEIGSNLDTNSKAYKTANKISEKISNNKSVSNNLVGKLRNEIINETQQASNEDLSTAIENRLVTLGEKSAKAQYLSNVAVKVINGESLSTAEKVALGGSTQAQRVISEYNNSGKSDYTNKWANEIQSTPRMYNTMAGVSNQTAISQNDIKKASVPISGVNSVNNGEVVYNLNNGSTDKASELKLDNGFDVIDNYAKSMTQEEANDYVNGYKSVPSNIDAETYNAQWTIAKQAGVANNEKLLTEAYQREDNILSDEIILNAYKAGVKESSNKNKVNETNFVPNNQTKVNNQTPLNSQTGVTDNQETYLNKVFEKYAPTHENDIVSYANMFDRVYTAGSRGVTYKSLANNINYADVMRELDETQIKEILNAGQLDYENTLKNTEVTTRQKSKGEVKVSDEIYSKLFGEGDLDKISSIDVIDEIAKNIGTDIVLEDINDNSVNGYIKDGVIHINANKSVEGMMFTVTHESVHLLRENNEQGYRTLRNFVFDCLTDSGINIDSRVQKVIDTYLEKNGLDINNLTDSAEEEIIANAFGAIINNKEAMDKAFNLSANEKKSLVQAIKNIIEKLKSFLNKLSGKMSEVKALKDNINAQIKMAEIFAEEIEKTDGQNTTNGVKYSKYKDISNTKQFKRWFGDWQNNPKKASKVVNDDGTPKVVYHGTNSNEFWAFDKSRYNSNEASGDYVGEGFFFTKNKYTARKYGKNVMPVYLDIKNPLIINNVKDANIFRNSFLGMYENGKQELRDLIGGDYDYFSIIEEDPSIIREELLKRGYDGLIDNLYGQYAVFEPTQIKSATDNIGIFDKNNPDIRYSLDELSETLPGTKFSDFEGTQFNIIQKSNPANDDYHTWIRSVNDILSYEKAIGDFKGDDVTPDYTAKMVDKAIKTGEITVYSSKPIEQGTFVTPSKMEAESYSGTNGKIYSKKVRLTDVAWIDEIQGQYANVNQKYSVDETLMSNEDIAEVETEKALAHTNRLATKVLQQAHKDNRITKADYVEAAKTVLEKYESTMSANTYADSMYKLVEFARNHEVESPVDLMFQMSKISNTAVDKTEKVIDLLSEERQTIKEYLKGSTLLLSDRQVQMLEFGMGANRYRQIMFGTANIKRAENHQTSITGGIDRQGGNVMYLTEAYQNLQEQVGYALLPDCQEEKMPEMLLSVLDAVKPTVETVDGANRYDLSMAMTQDFIVSLCSNAYKNTNTKEKQKSSKEIAELKKSQKEWKNNYRKKYKDKLSEEIAEIKKNHANDLSKQKSNYEEKIAEIKAKQNNTNAKRQETLLRRDSIKRISNSCSRLDNMISREVKKEGVPMPVDLIREVARLGEIINYGVTKKGNTYNGQATLNRISKLYKQMSNKKIDYNINNSSSNGNSNGIFAQSYNEKIQEAIESLAEEIGNTPLNKLDGYQLLHIANVVSYIENNLREAKNIIIDGKKHDIAKLGKQATKEILSLRGVQNKDGLNSKLKNANMWYNNQMLDGYRFFMKLGGYDENSVFCKIGQDFDKAESKMIAIQMESKNHFVNVYNKYDKELKRLNGKNAELLDFGLADTKTGEKVYITPDQALSIYLASENMDNRRHFMIIRDIHGNALNKPDGYIIKSLKDKRKQDNKVIISKQNLLDITNYILNNEALKELSNVTRNYFNTVSRKYLDECAVSLYGYPISITSTYFPITVNKDYVSKEFESVIRDASLENRGFTKHRQVSSNAVNLVGCMELVESHINQISRYASFTPVIKNFQKIYNYRAKGSQYTLKEAIRVKMGQSSVDFIDKLMGDIQVPKQGSKFLSKLRGNFAQGTLSMNIGVSLKQAASYPTAAAYIGWKPLLKALYVGENAEGKTKHIAYRANRGEIIEKLGSGVLWDRYQGDTIAEMRGLVQSSDWTKKGVMPYLMNWIQKIDAGTTGRLYQACKYYVEDELKITKYDEKGEWTQEYKDALLNTYEKVIKGTQPQYTVMHRPQVLRSKNEITKTLTMFMTQRLQNIGLIIESIGNYKAKLAGVKSGKYTQEDLHKAKVKLFNGLSSQIVAVVTLVAMDFLRDVMLGNLDKYRDDDDELTLSSIFEYSGYKILESLMSNVLGGSELMKLADTIVKTAKGETTYNNDIISYGALETISDIANELITLTRYAFSDDVSSDRKISLIKKILTSFGQVTGIPTRNAYNIVDGIIRQVENISEGEFVSHNELTSTDYAHSFYVHLVNGEKEKAKFIIDKGNENGITDKKFKSALKRVLKEDDTVIQGAIALNNEDTEEMNKCVDVLVSLGFNKDIVLSAMESYANSLKPDKDKIEEKDEISSKNYIN